MKKFIKWSNKGKEAKFSIQISNNELDLEILEGNLSLLHFIRYIVKYTDIPKIQYKRISPYRIIKKNSERIPSGTKFNFESQFIINFMKIDNSLQIKEEVDQVILTTYDAPMYLRGNYKIFIPDLMELIVNRNYAEKVGNCYKIIKDLDKPIFNQFEEYYPHSKNENKKPNFAITDVTDWTLSNVETGETLLEWHKDDNVIKQEPKIIIDTIENTKIMKNNNISKQDKKELLKVQINYCLDIGDKEEFMKLSKEYNEL